MPVNTYNFIRNGCIFYHAVAHNREHALQLAERAGFDVSCMRVKKERTNVRNALGRPMDCTITKTLVE